MKRWMKLCPILLILTGLLWVGAEGIFSPYEMVEYVPSTGVEVTVSPKVEYESDTGEFIYFYDFSSGPGSSQKTASFEVATQADIRDISPIEFEWSGMQITPPGDLATVVWNSGTVESMLPPGSMKLMSFRSEGVPGMALTYTRGDVPPPNGRQFFDPSVERPSWPNDSVKVPSIGPHPRPSLPLDGVAFAERLLGLADEAQELEWISEAESYTLFQTELQQIRQQIEDDQTNQARETIEALLLSLDDHRGSGLDDSAYYLFKANLEFFLHHLDTEPGPPITLNLTLKSKHVMPHRNERVELEVTPSTRADLTFTLYRVANRSLPNDLGEAVFVSTATGVESGYLFIWEGQTTTGEPAHNGNYELQVSAGDASQSVSVQVNRQQGKQSWLKLATRTLAYLGRPTLMGSVGYALLPGVTWLATVDEPAAGEKVALGG